MSAPDSWWAKPFGRPRENRFDALTDEERAEILKRKKVTRCPPVRVDVTFPQQLSGRLVR